MKLPHDDSDGDAHQIEFIGFVLQQAQSTAISRVDLLGLSGVLLEELLGPGPDALGLAVGEGQQRRQQSVRERL